MQRYTILLFLVFTLVFSSNTASAAKETVVLMPLHVAGVDRSMLASMEMALVEGLQSRYKVYSGDQVHKKVRDVYMKESQSTEVGKECDETKCMENIAIAFNTELIATASVTKRSGAYFLVLGIRNIFDDVAV